MPVRIVSAGGGGVTLSAASTGSEFTATLPANTGTVVTDTATQTLTNKTLGGPLTMSASVLTLGTAQASTSGTSIDFTGIPSWVRRITVMFNGVSTNGNNRWLLQLGAGSVLTSGYNSAGGQIYFGSAFTDVVTSTSGFLVANNIAGNFVYGSYVFNNISGNNWVGSHSMAAITGVNYALSGGGSVALSGTLDRIRITTVGGTDTFDAGSINIMFE